MALGVAETPAPGGNTKVPSFARENIESGKGVQFGYKQRSEHEIAERLGRLSRLAPGGNVEVPSFVEENKRHNKGAWVCCGCVQAGYALHHHEQALMRSLRPRVAGVVFGHRFKSETEIAEKLGRLSRLAPG